MHPAGLSFPRWQTSSVLGGAAFRLALAFAFALAPDPALAAAELVPIPELGLRVTRGFRVTQFADATLADDIYSLTLNSRGEVVVSGPGYIRTLLDQDRNGVAERAVEFARTPTGSMGMCFDGNDLLFAGDGGVWRFRDTTGDGQADGEPERLLTFQSGEHGGHAVRKGPDGLWYVIGGNDSKFDTSRLNRTALPGAKLEGGALLRFGSDNRGAEVFAHGFRNPYDFDFNPYGDLFTYDSDVERDEFLPWYVPTRLYHIAPWGHHGWRLEGYMRSWPRPGRYVDTVEVLAEIGRGSPTGVACYRHRQFPPAYHGGLFVLDWTFGRVYFVPLSPDGASYEASPVLFLEAVGTAGFAPTDVAVAPDGSLFISTGGRHTRGAVYHVQYVADVPRATLAANWQQVVAGNDLLLALTAPQPLEAWSRAVWEPVAARLPPELLAAAATDNRVEAEQRIRAIEMLTGFHGGLAGGVAAACAQAGSPWVRARAAWAMSVEPPPNFKPLLFALARDPAAHVRCAALEALRRRPDEVDLGTRQQALAANLAHPDKRVRQAAARLAMSLPDPAWLALWRQQQNGLPQARLTTILALLWRADPSQTDPSKINTPAVEAALAVLAQTPDPNLRAQALRLILLGLGDYHLEKPSLELYTAYEPALPLAGPAELWRRLNRTLIALFPSGDAAVDLEAARLLAILASDEPAAPGKLLAACNARSDATSDFHYLTVLSRLKSPPATNQTAATAAALVAMDRKLEGREHRPKQAWPDRFLELSQALVKRDPRLAEALMRQPDFARPAHLPLVPLLGSERYLACARLYFNAVQRAPTFPWTEPLVELLSALPPEQVHPLFRRQLRNVTIREPLLLELARLPRPEDRDAFLAGLGSVRPDVVRASMSALLLLPPEPGSRTKVAALRALRRLLSEPTAQTARAQALTLLSRLSGQKFVIEEKGADLARTYQPVFDWFNTREPSLGRRLDGDDQENPAQWEPILRVTPWARGNAERGAALYTERGCRQCHDGARPLGPDLGGAAQRLSATDLFNAILFPSRDIAPPYRMTTFRLQNGESYTGLIAFESADGILLQTAPDATVRLAGSDIAGREPSAVSFMPGGLLAGLKGPDLADLHAYLKTLAPR